MTQPQGTASPEAVAKFHANSDVDSASTAQHHTIGVGQNNVSGGKHNHNGKNSARIGKGLDAGFPTTANAAYSQAQIQSIIDALRDLGFGS
jgi:N-acetyl-anhydromuramyl-L-alanine amidase AmpD